MLELKDSDPGKAYATLKRMGAQPGDNLEDGNFAILQHLEENLTDQQSVERIAEYFCKISQEYPALDASNLSETVQKKLKNRLEAKIPYVSRYKVENMIRKAKKTKSGVPGDLPAVLTKEFGPELAAPLSTIYNNIVKTGKWPDNWKTELFQKMKFHLHRFLAKFLRGLLCSGCWNICKSTLIWGSMVDRRGTL